MIFEDIASSAFADHNKVTDIVLPSTIERNPPEAFAGCSGLKRITIPKEIKSIREGTYAGCDMLEDVYFEGSMEEWKKINIVHDKHEIEFGDLIPGTPVHEIKAERLLHVPGNDAVLNADLASDIVVREGSIVSCVYWVQGWPKEGC